MPIQEQLTQAERDKLEIDPDIDFREVAKRPFEDLSPNEIGMFKWSGVYHQLQKGYFMIRVSVPGGIITAPHLRQAGRLAREYGQDQLCITTRQTMQFHWIRQQDIYRMIEGMQAVGMTTRNACGDVCRNVVGCSLQGVCPHELGQTRAMLTAIAADPFIQEQRRNLPRKHKISVSGCASECGQAVMNCQGWFPVARPTENGTTEMGWAFTAGGGLGSLPHLARPVFAWVPEDLVLPVARATVEAHNLLGDRRKRRFARLKIVVAQMGARPFGEKLVELMHAAGVEGLNRLEFAEADEPSLAPFPFSGDAVIEERTRGLHTVRVRMPRSELSGQQAGKLADRAEHLGDGTLALTNRQNLELRGVPDVNLAELRGGLAEDDFITVGFEHLPDIVACVGTTMCNLAVSDTPNAYRRLVAAFDADTALCEAVGPLRINLNGCPNACGQHWIADIGFRGRRRRGTHGSEEGFSIFVGGRLDGPGHIAEFVRDVDATDIVQATRDLLVCYLDHRHSPDETFGTFARRVGAAGLADLSSDAAAGYVHEPIHERNLALKGVLGDAYEEARSQS